MYTDVISDYNIAKALNSFERGKQPQYSKRKKRKITLFF